MSTRQVPPCQLWWLAAGFAVWCNALAVLYAVHAIGCAFAWSPDSLRLGLVLVLLAHLAVIGWVWRSLGGDYEADGSETGTFLRTVIVWTTAAALVTTILTLGPALLLPVCM